MEKEEPPQALFKYSQVKIDFRTTPLDSLIVECFPKNTFAA